MSKRTPLFDQHVAAGAKMVEFGGWDMPLHYGSQLEEHQAVRSSCGIFDVSHMTVVDVKGADAQRCLRRLIANDVAKLDAPGKALYGAMLNERGGVVDDLIVYRMACGYRCVVNAATRDKDLAWMDEHRVGDTQFEERDLAMIAVQGPGVFPVLEGLQGLADLSDLRSFQARAVGDWFIGRTGYTGEDGVEIMLPPAAAADLWSQLIVAGARPIGLGARDTLRLEAGLNLYGQDLDEDHSALASNLGWTVTWDPPERDFIGRAALSAERNHPPQKLVGLVMRERVVLRHDQRVATACGAGIVTSGTFSPTLQCSIALARLPAAATGSCEVEIRGKLRVAEIVKPVFVRRGKVLI